MKTLFIRNLKYLCDENSNGKPNYPRLPSSIFSAAAYCADKGHDVTVLSADDAEYIKFDDYGIVAAWVPLFEGFDLHIEYLRKAKLAGKITVMILNDSLESFENEAMNSYPFIDVTVRLYEREYVLEKVLRQIAAQGDARTFDFPGAMYRDGNGAIMDNGMMSPLQNLHHLISASRYLAKEKTNFYRYGHIFIEVGRGCPYPCDFCFYKRTAHRTRRIDDIIDELKVVAGHFNLTWLHDLNMLIDMDFTAELCEAILKHNLRFNWGANGRIDLCGNVDLLRLMKRAGCSLLALGLESGDKAILDKIHKATNIERLDEAVHNCRSAGIVPSLNLMIGFPWENKESLQKTFDIGRRYRVAFIQFVRPLRGTPLYDEYKKLGLILNDLHIADYKDRRGEPMFPTLYLTKDELRDAHQRFLEFKLPHIFLLKKALSRFPGAYDSLKNGFYRIKSKTKGCVK